MWSLWDGTQLRNVAQSLWDRSSVALGTFDGVHRGHQSILHTAVKCAHESDLVPVALTFDRHPMATLASRHQPPLLTSLPRKVRLMQDHGIAHVVVIRFTPEFSQMEADQFIEEILVRGLGAKAVVVGYDFRFGRQARGNPQLIAERASQHGYRLTVVPPVTHHGEPLSSTAIRSMLLQGEVARASAMLGYPFCLEGYVVHGDGRGRTIGYPTANLQVQDGLLLPADGVYATVINGVHRALTVIGTRPSFDGTQRAVENLILDFHGDLYGKWLRVEFHERIRDIVRFSSPDQLVSQIERDIEAARQFFSWKTDKRMI